MLEIEGVLIPEHDVDELKSIKASEDGEMGGHRAPIASAIGIGGTALRDVFTPRLGKSSRNHIEMLYSKCSHISTDLGNI